jgi:hypothetical protein
LYEFDYLAIGVRRWRDEVRAVRRRVGVPHYEIGPLARAAAASASRGFCRPAAHRLHVPGLAQADPERVSVTDPMRWRLGMSAEANGGDPQWRT